MRPVLTRIALLAMLWWVLTEGSLDGWAAGSLVVFCAAVASLALAPPGLYRWRILELPGFALFFIRQSVLGGVDVARRAFDPRIPIDPDFVDYPLRLPIEPARVFFANTMSLLPGTLSVTLREDAIQLHILNRQMPVRQTAEALEERVAALFGVDLA